MSIRKCLFFAVSVILPFIIGCVPSADTVATASSSPSANVDTVYVCPAVKLKLLLPKDWHFFSRNEKNLIEQNPLDRGDLQPNYNELDCIEIGSGEYGCELCELWSSEKTSDSENVSLNIYIEHAKNVDINIYAAALKQSFSGIHGEYRTEFVETESLSFSEEKCVKVKMTTMTPDMQNSYSEHYYILEPSDDVFLVMTATWWSDNDSGEETAYKLLENITVGDR